MRHLRPCGLFTYWASGSDCREVHADPPDPSEAKPFFVAIEEGVEEKGVWASHVIPLSALVFARGEDHARSRVLESIRECLKRDYKSGETQLDKYGDPTFTVMRLERWARILRGLETEDPNLRLTVEPYPVDLIAAKVNWASNGGVF
jgi:hypothetical protein